MKHLLAIIIAPLFFTTQAIAGSTDYTDQRQTQESSYQDTIANQALKDYYQKNPNQTPTTNATQKKKPRSNSGDLHRKTFGSDDSSEVWGTKK